MLKPRSRRPGRKSLRFESLENRMLLAGDSFNDPDYTTIQWGLDNTGQNGGHYDVDIDAPEAWTITTGSMKTVYAQSDDGVDYSNADVYLNIWLNQDEIPAALRTTVTDTDVDGIISFRDLNSAVNAALVTDLNGTGYIDGGDLLRDLRWANGMDDDGNGKLDDLVGWDFVNGDNDPMPIATEGHGTGMAQWIGAIPNNSIGKAGVNHFISIMPVRIRQGDVAIVNPSTQALGVDYAVAEGAAISGMWGRSTTFSQDLYSAIDRARLAGHLVVAPAGNDSTNLDTAPQYPAAFDLDNIIAVSSFNANDGKDSSWNWGPNSVDLAGPTAPGGGTSGGAAHVAGVAALLKSLHTDWNYQELKDRILSTVEPSAAFAGKTVTGGRLNAAAALATTSISISDPILTEAASGTGQVLFTVARFGDSSGTVTLDWSTANGTASAGSDYVAASGQLTFIPGGSNSQTIAINVNGDLNLESAETFFIELSMLAGDALLADSAGQGTILDHGTKFYVVDDASTNRAYEYGPTGAPRDSYGLNGGNPAPRGVASNATGDRVWVIDANKRVYVYNTSGALLGSWTAGSLVFNATPEGIATDGTDLWIVDSKSDRVYRYDGGATRLVNSQVAVSSFGLASGNTNPKDIVTDGQSLWVVDDAGKNDTVFKYTLSGMLLGSWTIDRANKAPTGITIDPTNVSNIWIVDNGTDRVYQYNGAATKTSGSLLASTTFALAPGNTNPQGIADPPTAAAAATPVSATASVVADFPSLSTSVPSRNYTPTRRPTLSAATQALSFNDPDLLTQTNLVAERTVVGTRPRTSIDFDARAIIDTAFATLDDDRWSELATQVSLAI